MMLKGTNVGRDYYAESGKFVTRFCPLCMARVDVMDNHQDWKLGQDGCGGRYD
jgi:hypothetical protein